MESDREPKIQSKTEGRNPDPSRIIDWIPTAGARNRFVPSGSTPWVPMPTPDTRGKSPGAPRVRWGPTDLYSKIQSIITDFWSIFNYRLNSQRFLNYIEICFYSFVRTYLGAQETKYRRNLMTQFFFKLQICRSRFFDWNNYRLNIWGWCPELRSNFQLNLLNPVRAGHWVSGMPKHSS